MTIKSVFLSLILLLVACAEREYKNKNAKETEFDKILENAILHGYYSQLNEDVSLVLYKEEVFLISKNENGFRNEKFMLHLVRENNSFVNLDFFKDEAVVNDSLKKRYVNFEILHRQIDKSNYESIRIGQFKRDSSNNIRNLWAKQIPIKDIEQRKESYGNQLSNAVQVNLINEDFLKRLDNGIFFENAFGFYILLDKKDLFLISANNQDLAPKIMFHLIRADNTFENLSFEFSDKRYQQYLEGPYKNYKIAKIELPDLNDFTIIRIGQYDKGGNIWTQNIWLEEVFTNRLLTYEGQLKNNP